MGGGVAAANRSESDKKEIHTYTKSQPTIYHSSIEQCMKKEGFDILKQHKTNNNNHVH